MWLGVVPFSCPLLSAPPAHTVNEVSCGVGGVVQWPCGMCVQCGLVGSVCYMWDWIQASSSQRNWMVHVWAWSCSTHPLIMGNERGVVIQHEPRLTSLMLLSFVSFSCLLRSWAYIRLKVLNLVMLLPVRHCIVGQCSCTWANRWRYR